MFLGKPLVSSVLQTLSIELMTDVTIPAVYCLPQDRYVCVEYVWLASFTPPFRDLNPDNNFMCVTVADDLGCHDSKLFILLLYSSFRYKVSF